VGGFFELDAALAGVALAFLLAAGGMLFDFCKGERITEGKEGLSVIAMHRRRPYPGRDLLSRMQSRVFLFRLKCPVSFKAVRASLSDYTYRIKRSEFLSKVLI